MTKRQPRYKIGDTIGNAQEQFRVYEVHMGGMGEVYLCLRLDSKYPFALKTFQGADSRMKQLFEDETRTWIELGIHPNIVRCHAMNMYDSTPFMILDWILGEEGYGADLRSWVSKGALSLQQSLKFAIDIVRGLVYAGEKSAGIVHRDLKPDNVLVARGGTAKITDFGLTTILQKSDMELPKEDELGEELSHQSIRYGNMVGTPAYMPPEQWRGDADIDPRADIYAVGCMLYEMLTGRMPYVARTTREWMRQHLEVPIPQVSNVPVEVNSIISKCMAKNRDERYPTVRALLEALMGVYKTHTGETLLEVQVGEMTVVDYSNRGMTYDNLGEYDLALTDYAEAIRLNPNLAEAYNNRGKTYHNLGEYDHAIADFNTAIRLNPNLANAYYNRGTGYNNRGLVDRAIADFDTAIRLNPNFAQAYMNRGLSYANKGLNDVAITDFDTAIRINPNFANAWFNKGAAYGNTGRLQQALTCFEKAYQLGDPDAMGAIQQVKQLMGISPSQNNPQIAFGAFQRATSLGEMRQAVAQYPILTGMIQAIQQTIQKQVPPEYKPEFETRLAWLIQIAKGE